MNTYAASEMKVAKTWRSIQNRLGS